MVAATNCAVPHPPKMVLQQLLVPVSTSKTATETTKLLLPLRVSSLSGLVIVLLTRSLEDAFTYCCCLYACVVCLLLVSPSLVLRLLLLV